MLIVSVTLLAFQPVNWRRWALTTTSGVGQRFGFT
jgi:hypothetical protein